MQRIALPGVRKVIQPKTPGQAEYLQKIQDNDIVVGIGPAGTGKTYLAVAAAVDALTRKRVRRIVLARPAVEAGENLGFLPGDMQAKIDPYLRPLYDALDEMMPFERVQRALEQRVIEVAPLAFMRGRTLGDAFVIVDEAQNATTMQMKMLLTRLGVNSKMVITGDKTQVDLPKREDSGLMQVERILPGIDGIAFHYFNETDVVRHRLGARHRARLRRRRRGVRIRERGPVGSRRGSDPTQARRPRWRSTPRASGSALGLAVLTYRAVSGVAGRRFSDLRSGLRRERQRRSRHSPFVF